MTDKEKAREILSNLRRRKGTEAESRLSLHDIQLLKQIAGEKEKQVEIPSISICGTHSIGTWCVRCDAQSECKLFNQNF